VVSHSERPGESLPEMLVIDLGVKETFQCKGCKEAVGTSTAYIRAHAKHAIKEAENYGN